MLEEKKYIKFYKASDRYGFLSNFSLNSFVIKGKVWRTAEHYYQAQKFAGTPYEETIRNAGSAGKAKKLGNARDAKAGPIRSDWGKVKEHIMYEALTAKFSQNEKIKEQLLETGNDILVEFSKKDKYWGDGGNGSGLNRLGALLMNLREELRNNTLSKSEETSQTPEPVPIQPTDEDNHDEDYSESDEGIEKINNELDVDVEVDDDDIEPINNDGTIIATGPSQPTTAQRARKKKNRNQMRKNVWKDQTGSSILARDNESRDQVSVVNQNINIPMNVLPPNAKLVVHQHQYRRKYIKESDDEEEEDYDNEESNYKQSSSKKSTLLSDYVVDKTKKKGNQPVSTTQTINPQELITTTTENLLLLKSLSPSEPIYDEIRQNLLSLKHSLIQLIETTTQDNLITQLLSNIEAINELEH